jgi:hypothetical protein
MSAHKTSAKQSLGYKFSVALSTVLWILGFVLAFVVPKGSPFFWVPDFLRLIGFWPLLWLPKPSWPWLVFGVLNVLIGFVLQMAAFLPETNFTAQMILVKKHLAEQHSPLTWILVGFVSLLIGVLRALRNCLIFLGTLMQKSRE